MENIGIDVHKRGKHPVNRTARAGTGGARRARRGGAASPAHRTLTLERLGLLFVHPRQTLVPASLCLSCVEGLEALQAPAFPTRGVHVHTMHPLEHERALLGGGEENLEEAKRLVDFLVTRKLDYFEWTLLDTGYLDSWLPHAAAIVAHAHSRGVRVGIVAPYLFSQ